MYCLLLELKAWGVTGKRSIETAEHLMGSGDYVVSGRATHADMRTAIRKALASHILVSENSPYPCDWGGARWALRWRVQRHKTSTIAPIAPIRTTMPMK